MRKKNQISAFVGSGGMDFRRRGMDFQYLVESGIEIHGIWIYNSVNKRNVWWYETNGVDLFIIQTGPPLPSIPSLFFLQKKNTYI